MSFGEGAHKRSDPRHEEKRDGCIIEGGDKLPVKDVDSHKAVVEEKIKDLDGMDPKGHGKL